MGRYTTLRERGDARLEGLHPAGKEDWPWEGRRVKVLCAISLNEREGK